MGLEKLKFDKNNINATKQQYYWFMVRMCKSHYYFGKSLRIQEARVAHNFHLMLL